MDSRIKNSGHLSTFEFSNFDRATPLDSTRERAAMRHRETQVAPNTLNSGQHPSGSLAAKLRMRYSRQR